MNAQINLCINTILLESALIAFTMYKSAYVDLNLKLGINHWITAYIRQKKDSIHVRFHFSFSWSANVVLLSVNRCPAVV